MEPDTNQVEMRPTNRRWRRMDGQTTPRVRKMLVRGGHMSPIPAEQYPVTASLRFLEPVLAEQRASEQRLSRVNGEPRQWEIERKRRGR